MGFKYPDPKLVNFKLPRQGGIHPGIAYHETIIDADTGKAYETDCVEVTGIFPWMSITAVPFEETETGGENG